MTVLVLENASDGCGCCHGAREVTDIHGDLRPCSRCRPRAFDRWADSRRPKPKAEWDDAGLRR